jgi:hypothetical protein
MGPTDNDIAKSLIIETRSGFTCDSQECVNSTLIKLYDNWESNGLEKRVSNFRNYSREFIASRFAETILNLKLAKDLSNPT